MLGKTDPFLITSRKSVPRGTNGGVTLIGLVMSFFGGVVIGIAYYLTVLYCIETNIMALSPPQWPVLILGGVAGLLGSLIDSFIGATLQYSGECDGQFSICRCRVKCIFMLFFWFKYN